MATTEGVSRDPSLFSSTVGSPASMTAITELVVPRSMPSTFAMVSRFLPVLPVYVPSPRGQAHADKHSGTCARDTPSPDQRRRGPPREFAEPADLAYRTFQVGEGSCHYHRFCHTLPSLGLIPPYASLS